VLPKKCPDKCKYVAFYFDCQLKLFLKLIYATGLAESGGHLKKGNIAQKTRIERFPMREEQLSALEGKIIERVCLADVSSIVENKKYGN
jgi:hypothetical protein